MEHTSFGSVLLRMHLTPNLDSLAHSLKDRFAVHVQIILTNSLEKHICPGGMHAVAPPSLDLSGG